MTTADLTTADLLRKAAQRLDDDAPYDKKPWDVALAATLRLAAKAQPAVWPDAVENGLVAVARGGWCDRVSGHVNEGGPRP